MQLPDPSSLELLELLENPRFKASKDAAVCSLYLSISLGVGYCSPSYIDLLFVAKVDKCASHELGVIIYNDGIHDPIPLYDFFDELDCCL